MFHGAVSGGRNQKYAHQPKNPSHPSATAPFHIHRLRWRRFSASRIHCGAVRIAPTYFASSGGPPRTGNTSAACRLASASSLSVPADSYS